MTAQGGERESKVVPVTEHVIGLAWYKVRYAAGYASASSFTISSRCKAFELLELMLIGERIL